MFVAKMPMNKRDAAARIHHLDDYYEIWIHHKNSNTEYVSKYTHKTSAISFLCGYNGQTREISGAK